MSWLSKGLKKATKAVSKAAKQAVNVNKAVLAPVSVKKTKLTLSKSATKVVGKKVASSINKGLNVAAGATLGAATGGVAGAALGAAGQVKRPGGYSLGTLPERLVGGTGAGNMSGFGDILGGLGQTVRDGRAAYDEISGLFKKPKHTGSRTLDVPANSEEPQGPPTSDGSGMGKWLLIGGVAIAAIYVLRK